MLRNIIAALLLLPVIAFAQSPLKSTFGQDGKLSYAPDEFNDVVSVLAIDGDSLLVLAYCGHSDTSFFDMDIALTKMDALGNIDVSFGQNGTARFDFDGMNYSTASDLLLCNDGRIMVLGSGYSFSNPAYNPMCIMMLTSSGQPDLSFGINGTVKIDFYGRREMAAAACFDADEKLLIAGATADTIDNDNVPVIGRFTEYELADPSFGGTGKLEIGFAAGLKSLKTSAAHLAGGAAYDVIALSDGSMLVGGSYAADCFAAKLRANGTLDSSFSNDGYVLFQAEQQCNNVLEQMALLPDGMILIGISTDKSYDRDYYMGTLDPLTGTLSSMENVDHASYENMLLEFTITPQGAVVAAGRCIKPANAFTTDYRSDYFSIVIFHDPEQLFGQQKLLIEYSPLYQSGASAVTVQSDGTIVCAGFTNTSVPGRTEIAMIAIDPGYYMDIDDQEMNEDAIKVFPNPANDRAHLTNIDAGTEVILRNITGSIVRTMIAEGNAIVLPLEGLAPGVYLLTATGKDKIARTIRLTRQ